MSKTITKKEIISKWSGWLFFAGFVLSVLWLVVGGIYEILDKNMDLLNTNSNFLFFYYGGLFIFLPSGALYGLTLLIPKEEKTDFLREVFDLVAFVFSITVLFVSTLVALYLVICSYSFLMDVLVRFFN